MLQTVCLLLLLFTTVVGDSYRQVRDEVQHMSEKEQRDLIASGELERRIGKCPGCKMGMDLVVAAAKRLIPALLTSKLGPLCGRMKKPAAKAFCAKFVGQDMQELIGLIMDFLNGDIFCRIVRACPEKIKLF